MIKICFSTLWGIKVTKCFSDLTDTEAIDIVIRSMRIDNIDGFLIGGASTNEKIFIDIMKKSII